jgi:hypothetical protein
MTLNPKNREGFDSKDSKFLEIIDKYGWHVMNVAPRVGEGGVVFSYSTGMYFHYKQPEIILCGLSPDTSTRIINEIGHQIRSGVTFRLEEPYSDIFADPVKCVFRLVQVALYREYVCWSQWFYEGNGFPVWQCLWQDKSGFFPWEAGCHPDVVLAQPQLFRPPTNVM